MDILKNGEGRVAFPCALCRSAAGNIAGQLLQPISSDDAVQAAADSVDAITPTRTIELLRRAMKVVDDEGVRSALADWMGRFTETVHHRPHATVGPEQPCNHYEYYVLQLSGATTYSPWEMFSRVEPGTHHIREMLPHEWAKLFLLGVLVRSPNRPPPGSSDEEIARYAVMIDHFAGEAFDESHHKVTPYFKTLMASKGDFLT